MRAMEKPRGTCGMWKGGYTGVSLALLTNW
ncbi:hypothetical protein FHS81_001374 [Pseudochelatococcus contaminans]|uniref:Uncharacterized protein n=1 Tax=Pseudochelatococcus contaminans TaxID=1538103 RepID=A0A7W5Z3A6_9HYPH|nr:hypothetical protein [Pseudochelatococcus contaminans]